MGVGSLTSRVKHFNDGKTSTYSLVAVTFGLPPQNATKKDLFYRRATVNEIAAKLAVGHSTVHEMIKS